MTRDATTDLLKAASIFGVVFSHTPGGNPDLVAGFRFCVPEFDHAAQAARVTAFVRDLVTAEYS